jgi:hypothetical protein
MPVDLLPDCEDQPLLRCGGTRESKRLTSRIDPTYYLDNQMQKKESAFRLANNLILLREHCL